MFGFDGADIASENGGGVVVNWAFLCAAWNVGGGGIRDLGYQLALRSNCFDRNLMIKSHCGSSS